MNAISKHNWSKLESDAAKLKQAAELREAKKLAGTEPTGEPTDNTASDFRLTATSDGVILTCASLLKPKPVSWLWRDWLAQGKLHIFVLVKFFRTQR